MEQMLGTAPYQFEVTGDDQARIVELERLGFFGQWTRAKRNRRWVTVTAQPVADGTEVVVEASRTGSALSPRRNRAPVMRALQLVNLLSRGVTDKRTIYRDRTIPAGPISLVASWAGTAYPVFSAPGFDAARGTSIYTGTKVNATGRGEGAFIEVRLADATTGWVERDQIVPAPSVATREAGVETARLV